ncbi:hypothetical protein TWF106_004553 [Orbilia oligospora]|uniref:Protein kinase domain-containing protein n=1 Tax=Orbilia oligospora TaxID=2813651 RepID=A0A7C8U480_ORBOL|nr:hypothetical protein TWF106_004553 [Orbilia oligospora]
MSNNDGSSSHTRTWEDEHLYEQMHHREIQNIGKHSLIPPSSLRDLFTLEIIKGVVGYLGYDLETSETIAQVILDHGIVVFATLIWIKRPDLIRDFQQWNLLKKLPIQDFRAVLGDSYDTFTEERMSVIEQKRFKEAQWRFLTHEFKFEDRFKPVEIDSRILPFKKKIGDEINSGFSTVQALSIHSRCHDFLDKGPGMKKTDSRGDIVVIQKTLRADCHNDIKKAYKDELKCLEHFTRTGNENIVTFLASYTTGKDMCFLFHFLEMDLRKFLRRPAGYGQFQYRHTYFSALHGLASALEDIHKVKDNGSIDAGLKIGYHHDLRPANVLVNSETFILTDFGMSRDDKSEENSKTVFKDQMGDYIAPECRDKDWKPQNVGRGIDIWAFGCLMSEVLIYAYGGVRSLRDFESQRKSARNADGSFSDNLFYDQNREVKEQVKKWVEDLSGWINGEPTNGRKPLGDFVKTQIFAMLKPEQERPRMQEVCLGVGRISLMAHFLAVLSSRDAVYIEPDERRMHGSPEFLHVEYERLLAWGYVLGLYGGRNDIQLAEPLSSRQLGLCARKLASFFCLTKDWSISEQSDDQKKELEGKLKSLVDRLCDELEQAWANTANTRLGLESTADKQYIWDVEQLCRMRCLGHWRNTEIASPKTLADKPWLLEYLTYYGNGQILQQPTSVELHPTLFDILNVKDNATDVLSQRDKYKLAVILAEFIADTHAIRWPHVGFCSRNIIFKGLPDTTTWKSTGENTSERAVIIAKVQRPFFIGLKSTQRAPKQRDFSYNFYALGVMLLRIGTWSYVNKYNDERKKILHDSMGPEYQDVVQKLMSTELFKSKESDPVKDKKAFSEFMGIFRKLKESIPVPNPCLSVPQTNPKRDAGAEPFLEKLPTRNPQIPSRAAPSPIPPPTTKNPTKNTLLRRLSVGSSDRTTRTAPPRTGLKRQSSFKEMKATVVEALRLKRKASIS